jgi:DNA topoisomerase VI subunit A
MLTVIFLAGDQRMDKKRLLTKTLLLLFVTGLSDKGNLRLIKRVITEVKTPVVIFSKVMQC